jgi:hypothetical protein
LPHRWLAPGDSLYDHLGPEFTLIRCGTRDDGLVKAAEAAGLPLTVLDLDASQAPHGLVPQGGELVLVRPDQHVSWRGSAAHDPAAVVARAASS